MNDDKNSSKRYGWKRALWEWGGILAVIGILYVTGLHTEVLGTMQRAMLWTGFFDADISEIDITDGPTLAGPDLGFLMQGNDGEIKSLNDYQGQVLFVNVWASWCSPCVAEMPTIESLYNNVKGQENIQFILLSLDEDRQKAVDFMEGRDFSLPYHFPASPIPEELRTPYLPTTYVISKDGQIIYTKEGIADYSSMNFAQWMIDLAREEWQELD